MKKLTKILVLSLAIVMVLSMAFGCTKVIEIDVEATKKPTVTTAPVKTDAPESGDPTGEPTEQPTAKPTKAPAEYIMGSKAHAGEILNSGSFVFNTSASKYWTEEICGIKYGDLWAAKDFKQIKFDEGSAGVHFFATTSFTKVSVVMPTWDQESGFGCHMYLYLWDTDYETTLEGTPVQETSVENFSQFGTVFKFSETMLDGEYLLYITTYKAGNANDTIGVWAAPAYAQEMMECFLNDELLLDKIYMMEITYIEEPEFKWGPWYQYDSQKKMDD